MTRLLVYAATGGAPAALRVDGERADVLLGPSDAEAVCIAADPVDPLRAYAGSDAHGVLATDDGGRSWSRLAGRGLVSRRVLSIATSPCERAGGRAVLYAGTEPSMVHRSSDGGESWQPLPSLAEVPSAPTWSFPPRPWTHHVRWIALHHSDPQLIFAGIELGGVLRSTDGGATWEDRKPGSYHDAHALATHPRDDERVYEAAGGGAALSRDRGTSWSEADDGLDRRYVWALAVDPEDPTCWYVSASTGARAAHGAADPEAGVFRRRGDAAWEKLAGPGTETELTSMPYALLAPRGEPGTLLAGLRDGRLLAHDTSGGWRELEGRLPALRALSQAA